MPTLEHKLHGAVNVSVDGRQEMAGFAVSINGRFWVSTEVLPAGYPDHPPDMFYASPWLKLARHKLMPMTMSHHQKYLQVRLTILYCKPPWPHCPPACSHA